MSPVANCFGPYLSLESSDRDERATVEELRLSALQRYQDRCDPTSLAEDLDQNTLQLGKLGNMNTYTKTEKHKNESRKNTYTKKSQKLGKYVHLGKQKNAKG